MKNLPTLVFALLLGAGRLSAATFSTNAFSDAFVTTGPGNTLVNSNYGGAGSLSLAAPGLPQGELQSVLQFNLGALVSSFNSQFGAGQWTVQSVTLQLTAAAANNPIFNTPAAGIFGISWMQNDSWQEGTGSPSAPGAAGITFNSLQSTFAGAGDQSLGTFNFNGATSGNATFTLALTSGLLNDITSGGNLSLRLLAADSSVSAVFNSRNFGTAANRPLLIIDAVPEPGPVALVGLGFMLVLLCKFGRQRMA